MFPCQHQRWCHAYDDRARALMYNSFDVLLSPSRSEGFGIPILEAQASGTPVITLNFSSMPEITFSGLCLEPVQLCWDDQGGMRGVAGVESLTEAIGWAADVLCSPGGRDHYGKRARANALAFGWDKIVNEMWLPMLDELDA